MNISYPSWLENKTNFNGLVFAQPAQFDYIYDVFHSPLELLEQFIICSFHVKVSKSAIDKFL